MKKQEENRTDVQEEVKWRRKRIVEAVMQIEDANALKKIYTVAKTLKTILDEKEVRNGKA